MPGNLLTFSASVRMPAGPSEEKPAGTYSFAFQKKETRNWVRPCKISVGLVANSSMFDSHLGWLVVSPVDVLVTNSNELRFRPDRMQPSCP